MKNFFYFILGLFGITPKQAKTSNHNNQPPMTVPGLDISPYSETIPTAPTMAEKIQKASPRTLLNLFSLGTIDMTVRVVQRPNGKPPKIAKVPAPRSGVVLSHKIVRQDEEFIYLRRAGQRNAPVFWRHLSLVEQN